MRLLGRGLYGPKVHGFAVFIMVINKHCYTQNIKALWLMVSDKIFVCFPIVSI